MKSADISIIGPDSKGIVATITNFIFENQCNIEEVSQNVVNGTFFMNVKISINKKKFDKEIFNKGLAREAKQLGMKSRVFYDEQKQKKNTKTNIIYMMKLVILRRTPCPERISSIPVNLAEKLFFLTKRWKKLCGNKFVLSVFPP